MVYTNELQAFDEKIDKKLKTAFQEIELKSRALSKSLQRCFLDARQSDRFEYAYLEGQKFDKDDLTISKQNAFLEVVNNKFEQADFIVFREFVRLLRACSLHIGGHVSKEVKDLYNETLKGKRVLIAAFGNATEEISE
ncbi:MAG TPA: hypothetical protein V6C96_02910 [Vampirovibrionales bacterium]